VWATPKIGDSSLYNLVIVWVRKDVQLFEALYPVLRSLTQLQLVDDTTLAVGSEA